MGINWEAGMKALSEGLETNIRQANINTEQLYRDARLQNEQRFRAQQARLNREARTEEARLNREARADEFETTQAWREGEAERADARHQETVRHNQVSERRYEETNQRLRRSEIRNSYDDEMDMIREEMDNPLMADEEKKSLRSRYDRIKTQRDIELYRFDSEDSGAFDEMIDFLGPTPLGFKLSKEWAGMDEAQRETVKQAAKEMQGRGMSEAEALGRAIHSSRSGRSFGEGAVETPVESGETVVDEPVATDPQAQTQPSAQPSPESPPEKEMTAQEKARADYFPTQGMKDVASFAGKIGDFIEDKRGFGVQQVEPPQQAVAQPQPEDGLPGGGQQGAGQFAPMDANNQQGQQGPQFIQTGGVEEEQIDKNAIGKYGEQLEMATSRGGLRKMSLTPIFKGVPNEATMSALIDSRNMYSDDEKQRILRMYREYKSTVRA